MIGYALAVYRSIYLGTGHYLSPGGSGGFFFLGGGGGGSHGFLKNEGEISRNSWFACDVIKF